MGTNYGEQNGEMRINRYIMECKYFTPFSQISAREELIDTLWNVNKFGTGGENKWSKN